MKITPEQQQDIKEVLWHNLKYRETFNELYDHIMSGVESKDGNVQRPHELARHIIETEFGGWAGVKEMEVQRERNIHSQFIKKLCNEMKSYFRFPLILFTLLLSVGIYFTAAHVSPNYIIVGLFVMVMVPAVMWYLIAPFNRWSKKYKPSIKERSAERLGTIGLSLFNFLLFFPALITNQHLHEFLLKTNTTLLPPVTILLMVCGLSAIKIFQQDLQTLAAS